MKELLLRAARYNAWANEHFIQLLLALGDEVLDREITSSFPSLRKTVLHVWSAEGVWLQRFEGVEKPVWQAVTFSGNTAALFDGWRLASAELVRFMEGIEGDHALSRIVTGVNTEGEPIADELGSGLQHAFNHSTFHRGQLVTMLRQAGVTAIPRTDLITFVRTGD